MSLEKLGKQVLKKAIIAILDDTHCASLSEIIGSLPSSVKNNLEGEDRAEIVLSLITDMIRDDILAVLHWKGKKP